MKQKTRKAVLIVFLLLALTAGLTLAAGELSLFWATIDGGGGASAGGVFAVQGTLGQPDAGLLVGGPFEVRGGFWPGGAPPAEPPPPEHTLYLPLTARP